MVWPFSCRIHYREASTKHLILFTLLGLLFINPAFCETDFSSNLPPPADITPTFSKDPVEQEDRNSGMGAAIAMAAVGAAVAEASCIMLLKAAREEQDPQKKQVLMAQALQQCAQAAQDAANAAQNSDGREAIKSNGPREAQLLPLPTLENEKKDNKTSINSTTPSINSSPTNEFVNPDSYTVRPDIFDNTTEDLPNSPPLKTASINVKENLEPLDSVTITYGNKKGDTSPSPITPLGSSSYSFSKFNNEVPKALKKPNSNSKEIQSRVTASTINTNSSSKDHTSTKSNGIGKLNLEGILSKISGKNPNIKNLNAEITNIKSLKKSRKDVNIFQYATYRYKIAKNDGLIGKKQSKNH